MVPECGFHIFGFAAEFAGYIWTEATPGKKIADSKLSGYEFDIVLVFEFTNEVVIVDDVCFDNYTFKLLIKTSVNLAASKRAHNLAKDVKKCVVVQFFHKVSIGK